MNTKKSILIVLALMLAACLSVAALAESPADTAADTAATDAAKSAIEEAQAAADAAQTEATALTEALEAYAKAKVENRKVEILAKLKEELDSYVTAGTLTQEQADLILKYYAEQMTLLQNGNSVGMKNGRGGKGGCGMNNGMNAGPDANSQNNGFGGKNGRFGMGTQMQPQIPGNQAQAPEAQQQAPDTQPEQNPGNS